MNLNSLIAGFIGGLVCSAVFFLVSRARMLPTLLKDEKVEDLSYYGRQPAKAKPARK
ncbi:MAG: hypothetical protein ACOYXC_01645 [Candidatus Rifleibacteriota bacterium]